jgi:diadenosine tetraphosphate (Ap4A) HIT family hydrolase
MACLICERIQLIREGKNPYFVAELETGYVVLGDHQHFHGYTLFLCKEHYSELFHMPNAFADKHLQEMVLVSQAVYEAFHPEKMNYEVLGNGDSHIHWHLFPRNPGDTPKRGPVWVLPPEEMFSESKKPSAEELKSMVDLLKSHIGQLIG